MADLRVHDPDLGVHVRPILAFTMVRNAHAVPTYRFVRRFVERKPPLALKQIDPLIRELTHYRDLIDRRTEGDPP